MDMMNIYFIVLFAVFGLCLGSFYNVVILRSLKGESIVFPPSKCPSCGKKLYFWHNIPVLSYILLRGKCYFCKEKISIQYPIIELITMCLFVFTYLKFGITLKTLYFLIILSLLLIMTVTDLKERVADCILAIVIGVIGLVYNLYTGNIIDSILGLVAGVLLIELIAGIGYLIKKGRAMGEADTYVIGGLGCCFGLFGILKILLCSILISAILVLPVFVYRQFQAGKKFMCIDFVLFTLSVLCFKYTQSMFSYVFLVITALLLIIMILKDLKTSKNLTYLPFIPAIALSVLCMVFLNF